MNVVPPFVKKEGYLHCFTCRPTKVICYTCMRQLQGAGSPPDVKGDPCLELCHFCQGQQCHLSLGHEGKHACGEPQTCQGKTRRWYPEQVGTQNEQLQALKDVESRSPRMQFPAASEAPLPSSQSQGAATQDPPSPTARCAPVLWRLPTPIVKRIARLCSIDIVGYLQRLEAGNEVHVVYRSEAWVFL